MLGENIDYFASGKTSILRKINIKIEKGWFFYGSFKDDYC